MVSLGGVDLQLDWSLNKHEEALINELNMTGSSCWNYVKALKKVCHHEPMYAELSRKP